MPTVNVLGYGTVEFPDGMTQEEMADLFGGQGAAGVNQPS